MNKKRAKVLILFLAFTVVGCTKTLDIPLDPEIIVHFSEDNSKQIQLSANDNAYVDLSSWLNEHQSDWYTTSGKYPGGMYLKTGSYGIQVIDSKLVLYSTEYEKPRAMYVQYIEADELLEMKKLGE